MTGKDTRQIPGVISRLDGRSRCVSLAPHASSSIASRTPITAISLSVLRDLFLL